MWLFSNYVLDSLFEKWYNDRIETFEKTLWNEAFACIDQIINFSVELSLNSQTNNAVEKYVTQNSGSQTSEMLYICSLINSYMSLYFVSRSITGCCFSRLFHLGYVLLLFLKLKNFASTLIMLSLALASISVPLCMLLRRYKCFNRL